MATPVAIVPDAEPKVYLRVCVKDDEALVIVIALTVPISVDAAEDVTVEARGIVVRVSADVEARDILGTMFPVCVFNTAVMFPVAIVLVPSALWVTVVVPDAISQESFLAMLLAVALV